jgi:hypothetical protein
MSAQPEPRSSDAALRPSIDRAGAPATILPWQPRAAPTAETIGTRPYRASPDRDLGNRLGTARGLLLGLAIGAALWTVILLTLWHLLR